MGLQHCNCHNRYDCHNRLFTSAKGSAFTSAKGRSKPTQKNGPPHNWACMLVALALHAALDYVSASSNDSCVDDSVAVET